MASFEVDVSPDVLIWARKSIGLSEEHAAKKIGVSTLDLRYWEEGAGNPTLAQLRRMSEVYKRPLAVLLLPQPPQGFDALRDFRLLQINQGKSYSPALHGAFRRVQMQREVAGELAELEDEAPEPIELQLNLDHDPEASAERIRSWLGTPIRDGQAWQRDFLNPWIGLVEAKSILVTQVARVDLTEMRGCSISDQPFPAIIINGKDASRGKLFTLMHELVHILLRSGGICDLEDQRLQARTDTERIERFCNQVAAAVLMPRAQLLRDQRVASASSPIRWPDEELKRLASEFGVSMEAMLLRLVTLGRASWEFYLDRRPSFLDAYDEARQEPEERRSGPSYYRMKLRDFGHRYTTTVLDAYHRRDINSSELADYLEIKVDHIQKLENLLGARR